MLICPEKRDCRAQTLLHQLAPLPQKKAGDFEAQIAILQQAPEQQLSDMEILPESEGFMQHPADGA